MTPDQLSKCNDSLRFANSYSRARILLEHCPLFRTGRVVGIEWFYLLGENWSSCDNIGEFRDIFKTIFLKASPRQLQAMMNEDERKAWCELPEKIEAFRGCEENDNTGLSFSLSKDIASTFPFLNRYFAEKPSLITAIIPRERAVLKLDRNEAEIISSNFTITRREPLEAQSVPAPKCAKRFKQYYRARLCETG